MTKTIFKSILSGLFVIPLFFGITPAQAATPTWDTTGTYVVAFNYLGTDYAHDVTLAQNTLGTLSGNGGSPSGANVYTWVVTSGSVSGNTIDLYADYTATADAVTPQTVMHVVGAVDSDGTLSGTWSDNYQGGSRSGTWVSTGGLATKLGALSAEDFSVVNYDTGLGVLKGYSAGFGLSDATFAGVQSVVVKLYSGATLLQTNTATPQLGVDVTGTQISSPFDVSGNFNYVTDGYWVNVRGSQYGQSMPATKVVATVTLSNGKVVTAENTILAGDPTTIYPVVVPPVVTSPTEKSQCKQNGWKTFINPTFKNQGACVSYVEHLNDSHDHEDEDGHHGHGKNHDKKHHDKKSHDSKDSDRGSKSKNNKH